MIVAVKEGGSGDPNNNSRLATVIAKAKAVNMPNDNIKRTIDKALGSGNTDNYESVTYEGYGPGGVAVIVDALTDNRQRTAPEVRHYFDKCNGNLGAIGCVSLVLRQEGRHRHRQRGRRAGRGHRDDGRAGRRCCGLRGRRRRSGDHHRARQLQRRGQKAGGEGLSFVNADIEMVPQTYVTLTTEGDVNNMQRLIDFLEDNEDVQNVWHNWQQD
jgi:transcriptional/translational regulatory protein YebC/TACO1